MKKIYCVLIILLLATNISKAQTNIYHPFPDSNAVWNFHYQMFCIMWPGGSTIADYSIIISGDTSINNTLYHKLNVPAVDFNLIGNCIVPEDGYKGAVRQDTSARKVFIVAPNDSSEQLLYDFTLEVGDTVQGYLQKHNWIPDVVLDIDSVLVGNSYRKRWYINWAYDIYIIEGIGSTYGLVEYSPGNMTDHWGYSLTCFKQDNQILYPDTATVCDLITVSVDEISYRFLNIFPNPVDDELKILFDLRNHTTVDLLFFNSMGQIAKSLSLKDTHNGVNEITISLNDLTAGVYFLQLNTGDEQVIKKIIKYKL